MASEPIALDAAVVRVPAALLDAVTTAALEQERLEGWTMAQVEQGAALPGLYPPNHNNAARCQAWVRANPALR